MDTPIGQNLALSRQRLASATVLGTAIVTADLLLIRTQPWHAIADWRHALPFLAVGAYLCLCRGDRASVGLTLKPLQRWVYWYRMTLLLGLVIGVLVLIGSGFWLISGKSLPLPRTSPENIAPAIVQMCVVAPLLEEGIYRLALCVPLVALLGPSGSIAVSGLLFGLLHVLCGNPGPDNLVAGYFLAWCYLKSGTIVVPIALHALGNAIALGAHVGAWYWYTVSLG